MDISMTYDEKKLKHITNSGHVPPKEVHALPLILRQLIPNAF
jgi:hypothetical protein